MDWIAHIPLAVRYALLAIIGAWIGGQLNRAIYRLAYSPRDISPWSAAPQGAEVRSWADCLPVLGWWRLRREAAVHGSAFWVRPLLIELFCAVAFPWLYGWELHGNLLPALPGAVAIAGTGMLHGQFVSHLILMCLMLVATFIDFDERTIPDSITVPGTLVALLLAAWWPEANLPVVVVGVAPPPGIGPLLLSSPAPWSALQLDGLRSLALGCACYTAWLLALLNYTWTTRHGWGKALRYMAASLLRDRGQWLVTGVLAVLGLGLIAGVWLLGGSRWQSLLTALVGLAAGGSLVWMVRIIASYAVGREAMGFGDVTLLAMIGAFLGWQPAIMIFFMAPALGSLIAVVQALVTGHTELAFGPYLCAATAVMVVFWQPIWSGWAHDVFALGWFVPLVVFVCIVLMGAMLLVWRVIKERLLGWG